MERKKVNNSWISNKNKQINSNFKNKNSTEDKQINFINLNNSKDVYNSMSEFSKLNLDKFSDNS